MNKKEEIEKLVIDIQKKMKADFSCTEIKIEQFLEKIKSISFGNKYALWIIKRYLDDGIQRYEDMGRVETSLSLFHRYKHRLEEKNRNVMNIKSLTDLEILVEPFLELDGFKAIAEAQKEKLYQDTEIIYNGPEGKILVPQTQEASIFWGQGTKWCTASAKYNMFENYNTKGKLYIFILSEKDGEGREIKYQLHFETGQFMNMEDRSVSEIKNNKKLYDLFLKIYEDYKKNNNIFENYSKMTFLHNLGLENNDFYVKLLEYDNDNYKFIPSEFVTEKIFLDAVEKNLGCIFANKIPFDTEEDIFNFFDSIFEKNGKTEIKNIYHFWTKRMYIGYVPPFGGILINFMKKNSSEIFTDRVNQKIADFFPYYAFLEQNKKYMTDENLDFLINSGENVLLSFPEMVTEERLMKHIRFNFDNFFRIDYRTSLVEKILLDKKIKLNDLLEKNFEELFLKDKNRIRILLGDSSLAWLAKRKNYEKAYKKFGKIDEIPKKYFHGDNFISLEYAINKIKESPDLYSFFSKFNRIFENEEEQNILLKTVVDTCNFNLADIFAPNFEICKKSILRSENFQNAKYFPDTLSKNEIKELILINPFIITRMHGSYKEILNYTNFALKNLDEKRKNEIEKLKIFKIMLSTFKNNIIKTFPKELHNIFLDKVIYSAISSSFSKEPLDINIFEKYHEIIIEDYNEKMKAEEYLFQKY